MLRLYLTYLDARCRERRRADTRRYTRHLPFFPNDDVLSVSCPFNCCQPCLRTIRAKFRSTRSWNRLEVGRLDLSERGLSATTPRSTGGRGPVLRKRSKTAACRQQHPVQAFPGQTGSLGRPRTSRPAGIGEHPRIGIATPLHARHT